MMRFAFLCLVLLNAACLPLLAQESSPTGSLETVEGHDAVQQFIKKIEGSATKARESWPGVRERFNNGLPVGATLTAVTIIKDDSGTTEVIDVRVDRVGDGLIHGHISSPVAAVGGFKEGDEYAFPEGLLFDWVILYSDGTGEGNFVEEESGS